MNILVCINLCYAVINPLSTIFSPNYNKTIEAIVDASKAFDYIFLVNSSYPSNSEVFRIMPRHCVEGSLDCGRLFYVENRFKRIIFFKKKQLNAFSNDVLINTIGKNPISLCGFGFDVLESAKSAKGLFKNVNILYNCICTVNEETYLEDQKKIKEIYGE